jgi:uncharacterized protein YkwD
MVVALPCCLLLLSTSAPARSSLLDYINAVRASGVIVAWGPPTPEVVMAGWLSSPGDCENIMSPRFKEMGVAWVVDPKSASGVYWAQVFGTRRD